MNAKIAEIIARLKLDASLYEEKRIIAEPLIAEGEERVAVQYVSTKDLDRDGDVMLPEGCDLSEFERSGKPVFLNHKTSEPAIGSDLWIKADAKGIIAKTKYATTPRAEEIWTLKKEGHMKTSSVGYIRLETHLQGSTEHKTICEKLGVMVAKCRRVISKWLLIEHSDAGIAANPNTLILAISKGLKLSQEMQDIMELKPYPNEHACRLVDPATLDIVGSEHREHEGKSYRIIFGKPKGKPDEGSVEQAYRYPRDTWTADAARAHCAAHEGSFEAATGEEPKGMKCIFWVDPEEEKKIIEGRRKGKV